MQRLEQLKSKFASKYSLTQAEAEHVVSVFSQYFTPRWGTVTDTQLIKLMAQVANYEGLL